MGGSREAALKAKATNLANNPNYYSEIGRIGGKNSPGQFNKNKELAREAGKLGGLKTQSKWREKYGHDNAAIQQEPLG